MNISDNSLYTLRFDLAAIATDFPAAGNAEESGLHDQRFGGIFHFAGIATFSSWWKHL